MAPADFLDEKRREIAARVKELRPLVDEYQRLEARRGRAGWRGGDRFDVSNANSRLTAPIDACDEFSAPAGRVAPPPRPTEGQRHTRRRSARSRQGAPRHHDRRHRRQDGHQTELPVPRPPQPGQRRTRRQRRPRLETQRRRITPRPAVRPPAGARPPRANRMNSTAWPAGHSQARSQKHGYRAWNCCSRRGVSSDSSIDTIHLQADGHPRLPVPVEESGPRDQPAGRGRDPPRKRPDP